MATTALYRHRTVLVGGAATALFTTYWDALAVAPNTATTEMIARVRACFESLKTNLLNAATITYDSTASRINEDTGQLMGIASGTNPGPTSCNGTGDPLPFMTQALVRYETSQFVNGRAIRGRSFIPFLLEPGQSSGVGPDSTRVAALNTAFGLLGTTIVSNISQCVWHRPDPVTHTGGEAFAVTARSASSTWAVLKGRRP